MIDWARKILYSSIFIEEEKVKLYRIRNLLHVKIGDLYAQKRYEVQQEKERIKWEKEKIRLEKIRIKREAEQKKRDAEQTEEIKRERKKLNESRMSKKEFNEFMLGVEVGDLVFVIWRGRGKDIDNSWKTKIDMAYVKEICDDEIVFCYCYKGWSDFSVSYYCLIDIGIIESVDRSVQSKPMPDNDLDMIFTDKEVKVYAYE